MITAADIRNHLKDYDTTSVSDSVIESLVESVSESVASSINQPINQLIDVERYFNGGGQPAIVLNARPINDILSVEIDGRLESDFVANKENGILVFKTKVSQGVQNVLVKMKIGFAEMPDNIRKAIINLVSAMVFVNMEGVTEGPITSYSIEAFSVSLANGGKYGQQRNQYYNVANALLKKNRIL